MRPEDIVPSFPVVVRLRPDQIVVPPECACCGADSSRSVRAHRLDGRGILVPYCADCHVHASRDTTRVLATSVASVLMAATLAAGAPLLLQPSGRVGILLYVVVVALAALAPVAVATARRRGPAFGHAALGRAVVFRADGSLVCYSASFGDRLARASDRPAAREKTIEPRLAGWAKVTLIVILAVCPLAYRFHFPEARIVNLTGARLTVFVDGRPRVVVSPTSAESPSAGVVVRIPAGQRELKAMDGEGHVVDMATVIVRGGGVHLYAPGDHATCFHIETTGYGRTRGRPVPDEPLPGNQRFWALPVEIDSWFAPAPEPAADGRSSGGELRALRQAPCSPGPN
jgi:hypothetical protein